MTGLEINDETEECLSAPCLRTYESKDTNQHANNLKQWAQEYDQFSAGSFYGCIAEIEQTQIRVFKEYTSQALRQQCNIQEGGLWLGLSADSKTCRINGQPTQSNDILCRPQQQDFELITPEGFSIYGVVINNLTLQEKAAKLQIDSLDLQPSSLVLPKLTRHSAISFRYFIERYLATEADTISNKIHQDILVSAVMELLTNHAERATNTTRSANKASYQRRKVVVETIIQYAETSASYPVTIPELCAIAHVSRRTLQYSFESILGINPQRFIRFTRLNQVRRVLSNPYETRTISDIAFDFGFYHASQFAQDYKHLFGECPSTTVQRHQRDTIILT